MTARRILVTLVSTLITMIGVVLAPQASAASLVEVTNFGNNPGRMRMHVYVPDNRPAKPAIVVAMHGCGGSGPGFYSGSEFASLANRHGYIVIYPSAQQEAGFGKCFDTWSDAAKRRGGGSDPVSIISMVSYVQQRYSGDANRVYATGSSSGGMMTQHMLAVYPDVFKAAVCLSGTYDLSRWMNGQHTLDFHFSSPLHSLPGLAEGPHLQQLRRRFIVLGSGEGRWEAPWESWAAAHVLGAKGVPNCVDLWGKNYDHDWMTWREKLPQYLANV